MRRSSTRKLPGKLYDTHQRYLQHLLQEVPEINAFKATAEERAEPLEAELLHSNSAAVGMTQGHATPLQLTANIVHKRPKGKRVLVNLIERGKRAQACL
jgi:hypothetical protein